MVFTPPAFEQFIPYYYNTSTTHVKADDVINMSYDHKLIALLGDLVITLLLLIEFGYSH